MNETLNYSSIQPPLCSLKDHQSSDSGVVYLPFSELPWTDICSPLTHFVPVVTEMTSICSIVSPSVVMTTPARTLRRLCVAAWPTITSVNLSMTSLPILSATFWGSENFATGMVVPENCKMMVGIQMDGYNFKGAKAMIAKVTQL